MQTQQRTRTGCYVDQGVPDDESREQYLWIIRDLVGRGSQGIVLGCTEISLLVGQQNLPKATLYDTTALYVERAVQLALGTRPLPSIP